MSFLFGTAPRAGSYTFGVYGLGVRGDALPTGGTHGQSLLLYGTTLPAEAADEFAYSFSAIPAGLTFLRYDDYGRVEAEGPDGQYVFSYVKKKNGQAVAGPGTFTLTIGQGLSGNAQLADVGASGGFGPGAPSGLSGGAQLGDLGAGGGMQGTLLQVPVKGTGLRSTVRWAVREPAEERALSPKRPAEVRTLAFDFSPYDSVSQPTFGTRVISGTRSYSPLMAAGNFAIFGGVVVQQFQGGSVGATYELTCKATAPDGSVLVAVGVLPVVR